MLPMYALEGKTDELPISANRVTERATSEIAEPLSSKIARTVTATVEKIFIPAPILKLPEEVRSRIYTLALFPNGIDNVVRPHFSAASNWRIKPPALLQTCYEIRLGAIKTYYSTFMVSTSATAHVIPWLKTLDPEARNALGRLSVKWDWLDKWNKTETKQRKRSLGELKRHGGSMRMDAVVVWT